MICDLLKFIFGFSSRHYPWNNDSLHIIREKKNTKEDEIRNRNTKELFMMKDRYKSGLFYILVFLDGKTIAGAYESTPYPTVQLNTIR
jgi:hypothetical protein